MRRSIDSIAAVGLATAVGVAGLTALLACVEGTVQSGVASLGSGSSVDEVFPGSVAWRAGVRPGQEVIAISAADAAGGWSITTLAVGQRHTAVVQPSESLLRRLWVLAMLSLLLAAAGLHAAASRVRLSQACGCLGLGVAAIPLGIQGDPLASSITPAMAALASVAWISHWGNGHRKAAYGLAILVSIVVAAWIITRISKSEWFDVADMAMAGVLVVTWTLIVGMLLMNEWTRASRTTSGRRWLIDVTGGAVALIVTGALMLSETPLPIAAAVVGALLLAFPFLRRASLRALDNLVLADARERASVEATEAERARLARDLHDAPLQELAGVIKRLELVPGVQSEGDALRGVAQQLRSMATGLYPMLLSDLGLVAAIQHIAHKHADDLHFEVVVEVDDGADLRPEQRPPAAVELAIYRVIHEAISNSLAHSHGRLIVVSGSVAPQMISITVRDDGVGMDPDAARRALDAGHLGLASMRSRAATIGADLAIMATDGGTEMSIRWKA